MSRWFRMYDDLLDDPKVQRLPPDLFKAWVNLLCLASRNNGNLPCVGDIAFALRIDEAVAGQIVGALADRGLLDECNDEVKPHNWNSRQFKSDRDDTAAERQRAKRERDRMRSEENVTRDTSVTSRPPETDTDTEDRGREIAREAEPISEAVDAWNTLASEINLPKIQKLTTDRRRKLSSVLKSHGLDGWREGLAKIRGSPFCRGEVSNWRADFDFAVRESSFIKLLEGKYDGSKGPQQGSRRSSAQQLSDALSDLRADLTGARSVVGHGDFDGT